MRGMEGGREGRYCKSKKTYTSKHLEAVSVRVKWKHCYAPRAYGTERKCDYCFKAVSVHARGGCTKKINASEASKCHPERHPRKEFI